MNYYEQIFDNLSQTLGENQALGEIAKIFLFRNTKFSMPENLNKTDVFFQSNFIQYLQQSHLQTDDWQWVLSQYFRFGKIDDDLLEFFLNLDEESTIFAIRLSGIINNLEHLSWRNIKHYQKNYSKINEFIQTVEYLNEQYQEIRNKYLQIKKKWQWTHLDSILLGGLYLYEFVLTQKEYVDIVIPYQIDVNTPIQQEYIFNALHKIIVNSYKNRKLLTDKNLRPTLDKKLSPFLYEEDLNEFKIKEYQDFQIFIAFRIELDLFEDFVFNKFSYSKTTKYIFRNGKLNHQSGKQEYDFYSEKLGIFWLYWKWRGINDFDRNDFSKEKFEYWTKSNDPMWIAEAFADTHSARLLLKEVYGIEKIILNDNQEYDIFYTLFTIYMQQQYYKNVFIEPFLRLYHLRKVHPFIILGIMTMGSPLVGQNFYPIATGTKENKAKNMSRSWIVEGSNRSKMKQMTAILDFWTVNLNDNNKKDGYVEKPFYELDGRIIQLPQRIGQQNIYSGIVNYLRKLHKNRDALKDETSSMEKSLAELFTQKQFKVFCQYMPNDNKVGEIDLIVVDNQTVLIIELKSTFLKTNLKEAYQYQNFTLKKASYQLDRKLKYIQDNYQDFTDSSFDKVKFYSWIVDTTLEADHERFNQHLKISLEELIIYLKGHQNFMNFYKNFDDFDTKNDEINNLQVLIDKIEGNCFWENSLQKYQKLQEIGK